MYYLLEIYVCRFLSVLKTGEKIFTKTFSSSALEQDVLIWTYFNVRKISVQEIELLISVIIEAADFFFSFHYTLFMS